MLDKILKDELNKKYEEQVNEAEAAPIGLVNTEKVQQEDKKENEDYLKQVAKKMDDYVEDMGNEDFVPPASRLTKKQQEYIETHRGGNNMQLEYETEPSEAFKERLAKNVPYGDLEDKGNVYDNIGVPQFKANDTQAKMEKAAKEVAKQKGEIDGYYDETGKGIKYADQPVTKDNKKSTENNNVARLALKENKMKVLKYKKEFIDESHAISLIPNAYKVDEHIFEMTDGNLTVKVKWEGDKNDGEAYILNAKNENILSEEMNRMKELFGYDSSEKLDKRKNITLDEEQYFLGFHNDVNGFALTSDREEEEVIDDLNTEETTEEVVAETTEEVVTEEVVEEMKVDKGPEDRDEFDGRAGEVIGVDSDIKDQRDEKNEGDCEIEEDCGEVNEKEDVIGVDQPESKKKLKDYEEEGGDITEDSEGEETYNYGDDEGHDHKEEEELEHEEEMEPKDHIDAIEDHLDALKKDMAYDEDHEDRDEEGTDFAEGTLKEWCSSNDLLSENGNLTLGCIEKAKLSENKLIVKKSLMAESIINEKKKVITEAPQAPNGKGCAESEGGSGCIKKGKYIDKDGDEYSWYIINNKKGGVFKGCHSEKDCMEILRVPAVH